MISFRRPARWTRKRYGAVRTHREVLSRGPMGDDGEVGWLRLGCNNGWNLLKRWAFPVLDKRKQTYSYKRNLNVWDLLLLVFGGVVHQCVVVEIKNKSSQGLQYIYIFCGGGSLSAFTSHFQWCSGLEHPKMWVNLFYRYIPQQFFLMWCQVTDFHPFR